MVRPPAARALPDAYARIWAAVARIPRGRVSTYGGVALAARLPGRARLVGRALRELPPGSGVPWHRVVGAGGRIAARPGAADQRALLLQEGVAFRGAGVDLRRHRWGATRRRTSSEDSP